ncbi:MAG: hypothetical protein HY978_05040 [Candidatus Liptonbacteria bacterium]|nr:hypothetical protein [Candidatus Liptonbacteria bacterium]
MRMDVLTKEPMESLVSKTLLDIVGRIGEAKKLMFRLEDVWRASFYAMVRCREEQEKRLKTIALGKKIRVVSLGPSTARFQYEYWLKPAETDSKDHPWGLTIFESM